jgi:hypothetical protein
MFRARCQGSCAFCGEVIGAGEWMGLATGPNVRGFWVVRAPACWDCAERGGARQEHIQREGPAAAYKRGYVDGRRAAAPQLDRELVRELIQLVRPDPHRPERAVLANRVTAQLLEMLEGLREAA